ncbi:hypothetical protein ACFZA2_11045 [Microbacterium sp. NPDC007973]|uniref:hypothetical protein n=1 Tax=Microbacterium sp. NPDC007973 TaxID=3364182 RepID=UPI0036F11519
MSTRDASPRGRLRAAAVLAAALVLGTGTAAAQASWRAQASLTAGPVASGSFDLATQWVGNWSTWTPLYPDRSSDTPLLRVTETGAGGTTLRWRLTPTVTAPAYVTTRVYLGSCGSATVIASGTSYAPAGGFSPGQSVDLCVRATLAADAPASLQGTALTPTVVVTADQVVQ